jgi:hypothetical protein
MPRGFLEAARHQALARHQATAVPVTCTRVMAWVRVVGCAREGL